MESEKIVKMVLVTEESTYKMFSRSDQLLCLSERLGQKIVFKVYYLEGNKRNQVPSSLQSQ